MSSSARPRTRHGATPAPRRGGRPTLAEAAELDRAVRDGALRLFLEHGYEGTSMDAVARAAGTTKASLYKRFASKEEVFASVIRWAVMRPDWPVPEPDPPALDDLEGALTAIADAAVLRALHPSMVQLCRIAVAEAARFPDLAGRTFTTGFVPGRPLVVELLNRHAATGAIVADDPEVLAEHFLGMVSGTPARLAWFGIVREPEVQERHTRVAVRLFLRGLRPD
ncbi:TetR/AcrR family transcriptional regulator [Actinomadura rugatobispora]|uniref:TetR/AcrR family transcriptional regulator n=1 Tax=Actinomadura rugatobispora TaxID=1994 RepID=A0ABW1A768_9ACTN|nr:TetR/AcrR family transcriptional regulator [Actinomadura rugatobispora]